MIKSVPFIYMEKVLIQSSVKAAEANRKTDTAQSKTAFEVK